MEIQLLQMKLNGVILWILFNLIQLCQNNLLRLPMEMVELPMLGKVKSYHIEELKMYQDSNFVNNIHKV